MLFYTAHRHQRGKWRERRARLQLYLYLPETPVPEACVWEQLSNEQRRAMVQTLARLLVKAPLDSPADSGKENENDGRQQQD
jgi:hypothetical protein